jgi:mannosyltransferase OCH1-like enzyme
MWCQRCLTGNFIIDILPLAQDLSMFSHVFSLLFLHANALSADASSSSHAAFPKRIWSFRHQPPPPRMVQLAMATWRTYAPDYEAGFDIEISTSSMIF